jgi:hypothetical protein
LNRKVILLNLGLLALAGWLFWLLRVKWIELHMHEHTELSLSPQVRKRFYPPPPPLFTPMKASDYNDAVQRTLFVKDRNPNVIVEVKPALPPPPPPPMPPLPAYYGAMMWDDPVILLKLPKGTQKRYHAGEKVGPFELVSFDSEKIIFEWDGKTVERSPDQLREKDAPQEVAAASPALPPAAPATSNARSIGGTASDDKKVSEKLGRDGGPGVKLCVTGDDSPAGTIVDGYKKKIVNGMFGAQCLWELVNP